MNENLDSEKIKNFLSKRASIVDAIEIASTLYHQIGEDSASKVNHATLNNFETGCVINYFSFSQKVFCDFMCMNFHTVIGNYDKKTDSLKSWGNIKFLDHSEKNNVMEQLKEIRQRYSQLRNNFICHINDGMKNISGISITQLNADITVLRNIFNIIRVNNNLPYTVTAYSLSEHYSVIGLSKIISILNHGYDTVILEPVNVL